MISDDRYNASRLRTVTVAVLTSNLRLADLPGNVRIATGVSGLARESVVNVTQVATIDRDALEARVGQLPPRELASVDRGLKRALGLT